MLNRNSGQETVEEPITHPPQVISHLKLASVYSNVIGSYRICLTKVHFYT